MPYVERYFAPLHSDSSLEPCLKKSKLDYSAICKKKKTDVFIPLEAPSEKESSPGLTDTGYYGSVKGQHEKPGKDFPNGLDNQAKRGEESKLDHSGLCNKRNSEVFIPLETPSENWSPSGFSETRYYGSDIGKNNKSRVGEDFQYGFYIDKKPGPYKNDCSETALSGTEDSNKKQKILGLPKTDKWKKNNSEAAFSETSTAFIGPLYQPPPQVDTLSRTTNKENSKSPSFRITTAVSEKAADETKSEGGMDYEMQQFYNEINQLEAATDDPNVLQTSDNSQQNCSSHQSNAPTIQEVRDHHNQKPSSQPCNPLPCMPSAPIPPSYHPTPATISPAEHSTLLPIHNQFSWDRSVPIDGTNSFGSQSLPPPWFQGPPPPTFDGTNFSFVRPSLTPPCFQGPPPAFDRTNFSFVSQSLPPPYFQGPPPPPFDRTSSFVSQSLTPPCFQGPPPPAFDRTSSFVNQPLPPASLQGPSPPSFDRSKPPFDRSNSFDRSKLLPPASLRGPSPSVFDRSNSSFDRSNSSFDRSNSSFDRSKLLPPSSLHGPSPSFDRGSPSFDRGSPSFDRGSPSFDRGSPSPPASLQGPSPPSFDRSNSSFDRSKLLPPASLQGPSEPSFDRSNFSFDRSNSFDRSKLLPPASVQGSSAPSFDRSKSSFDRSNSFDGSKLLPPASLQGPSEPSFDRSNSSFERSKLLPPASVQGPLAPSFDRSKSSFDRSKLLPPASLQGPSPPVFDRSYSSFDRSYSSFDRSKLLPPASLQGSSAPYFDRSKSSFDRSNSSFDGSKLLPPASLQGPSEPSFDRSNSSFDRSNSSFDRSNSSFDRSNSSFDRSNSSFDRSNSSFDRSNSSFDRSNSSFDRSKLLPPASVQGPSAPSFDGSKSSFDGSKSSFDGSKSSFDGSKLLPTASVQGPSAPSFDGSKLLPTASLQGPSEPSFDRGEPSFDRGEPSFDRGEPSFDRGEPSFDRGEPSFDRGEPSFDRGEPSFDRGEPSFDRGEPSFDRGEPSFDRGEPSFDRGEPSFDRGEPSFDRGEPSFDRGEPSFDRGEPSFDRGEPSFDRGEPSFDRGEPSFDRGEPSFDRGEPSFDRGELLPPASLQGPSPPAFDESNSSFVSKPLPPPCFQSSPPHAFVGNHGPPPPRHNYPLTFPMEDDIRKSPYHENEKYDSVNDDHPSPTTQAPWHSSQWLPENMFSPQGRGFTESFTRPPFESSQQANQREDFYEQKGRPFNEILPQGGNVYEQYPPRFRDEAICTDSKRKLLLLRGVPGSGKSTLARILLDQSPDGIVFSTDDYFCQERGYTYDVKLLGDAHNWNRNRAQRAMDDEISPIIIDNTNIQGWEMKPYVQMALESGYAVEFLEPNTWWKLDSQELEKRNTHRVPREKISQMLERFEHNMDVGVVMNSVEPRRVRQRRPAPEDRQRWGASVDYTTHSSSFQIR
ncbi:uncharacterized protein LOC120929168 isoform X2 [Rana temporaria]|uniref:uncharacterized protein LOC120929168 isoform X2 n=1 Tax=Rana temporaria TaxID=8407 RepID=UPI001AAD6D41|nr:uncharacterized protein LOC120929168 isoform X2 [Rana temporaria]